MGTLVNIGNTCYMNAVLQCIVNCKGYKTQVAMHADLHKLYHCLSDLLHGMTNQTDRVLNPRDFYAEFQKTTDHAMTPYRQHDAGEFLLTLFQIAERGEEDAAQKGESNKDPIVSLAIKALNAYVTNYKKSSPLQSASLSQTIFQVKCLAEDCQDFTHRFEHSPVIFVPINGTIGESIDTAFKQEINTEWKCEKCKHTKCRISKKLSVIPKVMVLLLGRFNDDLSKNKDLIRLDFEIELERHTFLIPKSMRTKKYNLRSLVCHSGSSLEYGHYYSLIKKGGDMFLYDDETKRNIHIPGKDVPSQDAYIAFYEMDE